jgi:hypothetical protein
MLDSTGGVRLVRACTAMEPNATLSVPVVQCTGRSRFPLPPRSIANKKRKSISFCCGFGRIPCVVRTLLRDLTLSQEMTFEGFLPDWSILASI